MQLQPIFKNAPHFLDFWTKGNGKLLTDWSGAHLSFDRFDEFSSLYHQSDTLGDRAAEELFSGRNFPEVIEILNQATSKNGLKKNESFKNLQELITQLQTIPSWLNLEAVEKGAELCQKSGVNSLICLRDYSLMGGYDYAYLNKPLIYTGALKKGAVKRLADTLDFWVNVTRKDALQPYQKGVYFCLKTRIIHSYSRLMLQKKIKNWDYENWGIPINLWDMTATYLGFSLVFLHGLKKLKIEISEEEEAGHFQLWKYVGHLIGIPEKFLPNNRKEATENFYLWTSIQAHADQDSALLAKSLLDENLEATFFKYQFQRKILKYLHGCMNWFLLDEDVNRRLQIPELPLPNLFPNLVVSRNIATQRLFSREKQIETGHKIQMQVLDDYLKTAVRNKHE